MSAVTSRIGRNSRKSSLRRSAQRLHRAVCIEPLEGRVLLAVDTFIATGDWSQGYNWSTGSVPAAGDDAVIESGANVMITTGVSIAGVTVAVGASLHINGGTLNIGSDAINSAGTFQLNGGTLIVGAGNNTLGGNVTWSAGTINTNGQTLTNTGNLTLNNSAADTLNGLGKLVNQGNITMTGVGGLNIDSSFNNDRRTLLDNQAGGIFSFQADAGIAGVNYGGSVSNEGTINKTAGNGTSSLGGYLTFSNSANITVQTGAIQIATAYGTNTGGNFTVAGNATLDLTGGTTVSYQGNYTGSGAGQVILGGGTLQLQGATSFAFPTRLFQWSGGTINTNGQTLTNTGAINFDDGNTSSDTLTGLGILANQGKITESGLGGLNINSAFNNNYVTRLDNRAGATFSFQADASVNSSSYNGTFTNEGTIYKTAGNGTSVLTSGIAFSNSGNITVQTGAIQIAAVGTSNGGNFSVAGNATLDLTGNSTVNYQGNYTGSGAGQIILAGGTLQLQGATTFDFATGLFQWSGGAINTNGQTLTNTGVINLDDGNASSDTLTGLGILANQNTITASGLGGLNINSAFNNDRSTWLDNQAGATFSFQTDAGVAGVGYGGKFTNEGTINKTAGSGTSGFSGYLTFINNAADINVQAGTLQIATAYGTNTGGDFTVASGTVLDLTGGQVVSYQGNYTATGLGTVEIASGDLAVTSNSAAFDFPSGIFQWSGGTISIPGGATLTNNGDITLSNLAVNTLNGLGELINLGTMELTDTGGLNINSAFNNNYVTRLDNRAGATFSFQADASVDSSAYNGTFTNEGTINKTAGAGTSQVAGISFSNVADIDVQTGTIQIAPNLGSNTDGNFTVAGGATLDLTGGQTVNYQGNPVGSGAGHIIVGGGTIALQGSTTFDYPVGLFQWSSGIINTNGHTLTNAGDITLSNTAAADTLEGLGSLANQGTMELTDTGGLNLASAFNNNYRTVLDNQAGATLTLASDASIGDGGYTGTLTNEGTIQKTAGNGTSTISSLSFTNPGTVIAASGNLSLATGAPQFASGTLTAGTWEALKGAKLTVSSANITVNQANVIISGVGASFPEINTLTLNEGNFSVVNGAVFNGVDLVNRSGTVTVGPGSVLNLTGNYSQTLDATLAMQIGGSPGSMQFGQLNATGTATLSGTLNLQLADGYGPTQGQIYQIGNFTAQTYTGNFTTVQGKSWGRFPIFAVAVNSTNITLTSLVNAADLAVSAVTAPTTAAPGALANITYTVTNGGDPTVAGSWVDSVFLSSDGQIDSNAVLLGRVTHTGDIATGGNYTGSLTAALPAVAGNCSVIVEVDSRGLVPDFDRSNNIGMAPQQLDLVVPTLTVGTLHTATITNLQDEYYQVQLQPGQDVTLVGNYTVSPEAEMYVSYGQLPTRTVFDEVASNFFAANPSIMLTTPQGGTYYILLHGREGCAGNGSSYTIEAASIPFEVRSISPNQGSNQGMATVTVIGSHFTPETTVTLLGVGNATLPASKVQLQDSNTLYATFALTSTWAGTYAVQVSDNGQTSTLPGAFTVTSTQPTAPIVNITGPGQVRSNQIITLTVTYSNPGQTDIPAPILYLTTNNGEFRLPGDTVWYPNSFQVLGINQSGGPAGVLPPGYHGQIQVQLNPLTVGSHIWSSWNVSLAAPSTAINWGNLSSAMQPAGIATSTWNVVFANFVSLVGGTYGTYQTALDAAATYLSQLGETVDSIPVLDSFELAQASDFGSIIQRNTLSAFGMGVVSPGAVATTDAAGNVTIQQGGTLERFILQGSAYVAQPGDLNTLSLVGGVYQLQMSDGTLEVFNANGTLNYSQAVDGTRTTYAYTSGLLAGVTDSATGQVTTYTYDKNGMCTQITDGDGRVTTLTYDASDQRLLNSQNALGNTTYTYVTTTGSPAINAVASVTYPDGSQLNFTYDSLGRPATMTANGGAEPISFAYNQGEISATDALNNTTSVLLDQSGNPSEVIDPLGNVIWQASRNSNEEATSATLPGWLAYTANYNANGDITSATDPLGNKINASYNASAELISLTDARGDTTHFTYNTQNELTSILNADGTSTHYAYNAAGDVSQLTTANGAATSYTYNADGFITSETFADSSTETFTYDGHNNLLTATNASGTINMTYDSADRLTEVTYANGDYLKYTYNAAGQRSQLQDQTGYTVNYQYDALGRLSELTDGNGTMVASYTYDADGRLAKQVNANGTYTTYTYNADGDETAISNYASGGAVQSYTDYTYSAQGLPITMSTAAGNYSYGYDADGQLISVQAPGNETITYKYDAAGNRIAATDSGVLTPYTTNNMNQYTAVGGADYRYDADGNIVSMANSSGTTTYSYNLLGQLTQVNSPTSGTTTYQYDALGNLISQTQNGTVTNFLVDPTGSGNVIGEFDGSGDTIAQYTYGVGLVSQVTGSGSDYYGFDLTGSTTQLTDSSGNVLNTYSYLPFGQTTSSTGSTNNPFTYVGQAGVMSQADGLYYMRNRFYDPATGRFTQPDPLGISGGDTNTYRYVGNDPVSRVDPTGQWYVNIGVSGGWGVGGTVGVQIGSAGIFPYIGGGATTPGVGGSVTVSDSNSSGGWSTQGQVAVGPGVVGATGSSSYSPSSNSTSNEVGVGAGIGGSKVTGGGVYQVYTFDPFGTGTPPAPKQPSGPWDNIGGGTLGGLHGHCTPDNPFGDPDGGPGGPGNGPGGNTEQHNPGDPNDMDGPTGYGTSGFVQPIATLPYEVEFENEPTADAPAQQVFITQQLSSNLNWSTFSWSSFGFGGQTFTVPSGQQSFTEQIDETAKDGLYVDVTGNINMTTGEISWTFSSIDPTTLDVPYDILSGFLPPDVTSPQGEGWISYTVQPKAGLATGAAINAQAVVVFDNEAALNTPALLNTVDAGVPTSTVAALPAVELPSFTLNWSGSDGVGGSGIAAYNVYVSEDAGNYTLFQGNTTATSATFTGTVGQTYGFYSVATNNVGTVQPTPTSAQVVTTFLASILTPVFSNLSSSAAIAQGTIAVTFSGNIGADGLIPANTENVLVTLNGNTQDAAITASGNFTTTFNVSALAVSATPYQVTYVYSGDSSFKSITDNSTTKLTVTSDAATGSIAGTIYGDTGYTGVWSPADPELSDVMVYIDVNGDGKLDVGDLSTTTNAYGNYYFGNLKTGLYAIREVPPGGYVQSNPAVGALNVAAIAGQAVTGQTFLDAPTGNATQVAVYRLYSPVTLEHLYTTDPNEYNTLISYAGTWNGEGEVFSEYSGNATVNGVTDEPLYRLYDAPLKQHFWTDSYNEYNTLRNAPWNWNDEGIVGYVLPTAPAGVAATPLYRMMAPQVHLWTTDVNEYDSLVSDGWTQEGVIGYVL